MQVIESILADAAQIAALRRDIHAHPELCFEEKRTSDLIAEQLTSWASRSTAAWERPASWRS